MNVPIFAPPSDTLVAIAVERLDTDLREAFEERAGIIEHDGKLPRAHAECLALIDLLRRHPQCLTGLVIVEVEIEAATLWVLTSDLARARHQLSDIGGRVVAVLDPVEVVEAQYGGAATLVTLG